MQLFIVLSVAKWFFETNPFIHNIIPCFQFVAVLNSKKAKLRELRGRLSKQKSTEVPEEEEEESSDRTESFDEEERDGGKSEEESKKKLTGTSEYVLPSRSRGRKRK